jgi:hypothetical protein
MLEGRPGTAGARARQERRCRQMADQIAVIDLAAALSDSAPDVLLDAVRCSAEQAGVIQVVNHGGAGRICSRTTTGGSGACSACPGRRRPGWRARAGIPTAAGGSGRTTSAAWSWSGTTWPSSTRRRTRGRQASPLSTPGSTRTRTYGRPADPELRGAGAALHRCRAPARRARAAGCTPGRWAFPPAPSRSGSCPHARLTTNDYPTWTYPDTSSGRGQAAPA